MVLVIARVVRSDRTQPEGAVRVPGIEGKKVRTGVGEDTRSPDAVAAEFGEQGAAVDTEHFGGTFAIAVAVHERLFEDASLGSVECGAQWLHRFERDRRCGGVRSCR